MFPLETLIRHLDKESELMLHVFGESLGQSIKVKEEILLPAINATFNSRISYVKVCLQY